MAFFEKNPDIIRLNIAKKKEIISEEQYNRIKEYLDSEETDVYDLGKKTLMSLIKKSADGIS
jgi:hypothetical protein